MLEEEHSYMSDREETNLEISVKIQGIVTLEDIIEEILKG